MVALTDAKSFLRVDYPEDDTVIQNLIDAAENHLTSIGVDMTASPLPEAVEHAQLILVSYWYDNRGEDNPKSVSGLKMSLDRFLSPYIEVTL